MRYRYCGVLVSSRSAKRVQDEIAERDRADAERQRRKEARTPPVLHYRERIKGQIVDHSLNLAYYRPVRGERVETPDASYSVPVKRAKIHPEELAWWAAIRQQPDEYTTWLVYADWLHESGDEETATTVRQTVAGIRQVVADQATPPVANPSKMVVRPITRPKS